MTTTDGRLYAVNWQKVNNSLIKGGIERSLDPCRSSGPFFETITSGLDDGIVLKELWIQGDHLWTVDTTNNKLLAYTDTLASPVILASPSGDAPNLDARNITISWGALEGATGYHWQVDTDNQFTGIPNGLEGETDSTSAKLTALVSNTVYYWRVRAVSPVTSPWSEIRSFNTNVVPEIAAPKPTEPKSTTSASVEPVFKWSASEGAEGYELQVSGSNDFLVLIITKTCNSNIWKCESALAYNTSYYWRVRAVSGNNMSPWSEVNIFTTESVPTPSPSPSPSQTVSISGGSGGSGGLPRSKATPTPKSTPTLSPLSTETPASSTLSPDPSPSVEPRVYIASASTTKPVPTGTLAQVTPHSTPAASITPPASTSESGDATFRLIFFLLGGLVVLTVILVFVVVYMFKKFKKY